MKRLLLAAVIIGAGIVSAYASGFMLLHVGQADGSGAPLVSCASTGIFDLSNVCNDIYFIGTLK